MSLDDLPADVLLYIVEFVPRLHGDPLLSLKLTNKRLHAVANKVSYRVVGISVQNATQLHDDAVGYKNLLARKDCLSSVKHFILKGYEGMMCLYDASLHCCDLRVDHDADYDDICPERVWAADEDETYDPNDTHAPEWPPCPASLIPVDDPSWVAVRDLVSSFTGLTDITCACEHQLPAGLIDSFDQRIEPKCRLHVRNWSVRDPEPSNDAAKSVRVLISPILSTLRITYLSTAWSSSLGPFVSMNDNGLVQAVEKVTTYSTSPSYLRRNSLWTITLMPDSTLSTDVSMSHGRPLRLTSLMLDGDSHSLIGLAQMRIWTQLVDFQGLRKLSITPFLSQISLQLLFSMNLHTLEDFEWTIVPTGNPDKEGYMSESFPADAKAFLHRLPKLKALTIMSWMDEPIFDAILCRHGATLEHLKMHTDPKFLRFFIRQEHLTRLVRRCAQLVVLDIDVTPDRGAPGEGIIYKTLGSLVRLEKLSLSICLTPYNHIHNVYAYAFRPDETTFMSDSSDSDDSPPAARRPARMALGLKGVQTVLRNAAMDKGLVLSIYNIVSSAKPTGSVPLQFLEVDINGLEAHMNHDAIGISTLICLLARVFSVERHYRWQPGNVRVDSHLHVIPINDNFTRSKWMKEAFCGIWPAARSRQDWWNGWESIRIQEIDSGLVDIESTDNRPVCTECAAHEDTD